MDVYLHISQTAHICERARIKKQKIVGRGNVKENRYRNGCVGRNISVRSQFKYKIIIGARGNAKGNGGGNGCF